VFAANADLEVRTDRPAAFDADFDQFSNAFLVDGRERIIPQDFLFKVRRQEPAMSSRLKPKLICVRSLVPNEKNSACSAILFAVRAAREFRSWCRT